MMPPAAAAVALALFLAGAQLPPADAATTAAADMFHICRRDEPQMGECIKMAVRELLPKLAKGIPELKIPSHEPLFIPRTSIRQGSGPVTIDSTFTDQVVTGISNVEITDASLDLDNNSLDLEFKMPFLHISGNYNIDGRILLLPIRGNGDSHSNYTGVSGTAMLKGHRVTRKGKEYLEPDEMRFDMRVQRAKIQMNNLFNGDKTLGATMNRFLEENWQVLYNEVKPVVDESIGAILLYTARGVFRGYPIDELFPQ